MAPARSWRAVLVLLLLLLTMRWAGGGSPAGAAGSGAPRQRPIQFDSLVVQPAAISPGCSCATDSTRITLALTDTTTVTAWVGAAGAPTRLRTLLQDSTTTARTLSFWWNGRDDGGLVVPDGDYVLHFDGTTVREGVALANQRPVRVDTTAPQVAIVDVAPRLFMPQLEGQPQSVRVRLRITQSQPTDSLSMALPPHPEATAAWRAVNRFAGDGDYVVVCEGCDSVVVADGRWPVVATVRDAAGNSTSATDHFDKNSLGPLIQTSHPARFFAGGAFYLSTQHADSLVGTASDRHPVGRVTLRLTLGDSTHVVDLPRANPTGPDTLFAFRADLSAWDVEGQHRQVLRSEDVHGVAGRDSVTFEVDRTPPPPPAFQPRPGPSRIDTLSVFVAVDPTSVQRVSRQGGVLPDTTLFVPEGVSRLRFFVRLRPGDNLLTFRSFDRAGNASAAATVNVVWEDAAGLSVPERFTAGNTIQVSSGTVPAQDVEVRIYATDGALVRRFESRRAARVYNFVWDLRSPEGRRVKNGAYLVRVRLRRDGGEEILTRPIAILE